MRSTAARCANHCAVSARLAGCEQLTGLTTSTGLAGFEGFAVFTGGFHYKP